MPQPPTRYQEFRKRYRAVVDCYERLSQVCHELGPLPTKTRALVKLGMAIGGGSEGAIHAHARLARDAGWSNEAIRHVALLATTTLGFPTMMRAHALVEDVLIGSGPAAKPRPARVGGGPARRRQQAPSTGAGRSPAVGGRGAKRTSPRR